jgi:hypothetical protein
LIERNRVLLAVKLFPGSLLWANSAYLLARIVAGMWAALRNSAGLITSVADSGTAAFVFAAEPLPAASTS